MHRHGQSAHHVQQALPAPIKVGEHAGLKGREPVLSGAGRVHGLVRDILREHK